MYHKRIKKTIGKETEIIGTHLTSYQPPGKDVVYDDVFTGDTVPTTC